MADSGQNETVRRRRKLQEEYSVDATCYGDLSVRLQIETKLRHFISFLTTKGFNLEALDGITVTADCRSTALSLQKLTTPKQFPIEPVDPPDTIELARTFAIHKLEKVRFHIALERSVAEMLLANEEPLQILALATLAHEAAHVQHEDRLYRRLPSLSVRQLDCGAHSCGVLRCAMDVWSEYAATRSAIMFRPQALLEHALVFQRAVERYMELVKTTSAPERNEILSSEMLICAGYLLGALAGMRLTLDSRPRLKNALHKNQQILSALTRLQEILDSLWGTAEEWQTVEIFDPICDLVIELG